MKKLLLLILLLTINTRIVAQSIEERRSQVISIIDQELMELTRLNKQTGSRNPNLLLRMAELLLEKARRIKDQENARYLGLTIAQRATANKSSYFKRSKKYFIRAQKACYFILKRFKGFKQKGDVYYILAYNAQEFQQGKKAKEFFKRAMKYSNKNSNAGQKSKIALAEIYYNQKSYSKAIGLYEQAFRLGKDRWYTKHALNLAWCYFRTKRKSKAISLANKIYKLSKSSRYVDMRGAIERDIAFFYSDSGRIKDAIRFYKSNGKDTSKNLLKVAKHLISQGKHTSAEHALAEAKIYASTPEERIDANISLLGLYERYGKTTKHLRVCRELYKDYEKGNLNEDRIDQLKYHVQRMSALLQKKVASKRYQKQRRTRRSMAKKAVAYFNILSSLDSKNVHRSTFHAAETNYASGNFNESVGQYERAYELSRERKDRKIAKLSLEGMIAALGAKGITKATEKKYLTKAYLLYIQSYPRSKKSYRIYQRLYSSYIKKKDLTNAEKTLILFKRNYPKSYSKQEIMIAQIMDEHKNTKNKKMIKSWVRRINNGEFKVSKKYARTLKLLLLSMQFEGVEKFNSKGDKTNALKGYVQIYRSKESNNDAKKNAAYNISVLFYELGNIKYSYLWADRALKLMNSSDVSKFSNSFLAISSDLFNRLAFDKSISINQRVFKKLCKKKDKNKKIFFRNTNVILLSDNMINESQKLIKKAVQCNIDQSEIKRARIDLMNAVIEGKQWGLLESVINTLSRDKGYRSALISPLSILRKAFVESGRERDADKVRSRILKYYSTARKQNQSIPLEALDVVAQFKLVSLERLTRKLKSITLRFPEKTYNNRLKKKFTLLDKVTTKALKILEVGSGKGIVSSYKYLVISYQSLVDDILMFAPEKKSQDYIKSFQGTMKKIVIPLKQKANDFKKEARRQIVKSSILSFENSFFLNNENLKLSIEYRPSHEGVLMDRAGGK